MIHRHGENILISHKEIPKEAKLVEKGNSLIIGHSESGHHHILTVPKTAEISIFEHNGEWYLDVPVQAKLEHQKTHEKHDTQVVEPGVYKKSTRHSYSYSEKVMRRVID